MRGPMRRLVTRIATVVALSTVFVGGIGVTAAQASDPTITSFNPTSGSIGTLVTITGTHFNSPVANDVEFDGHNAGTFTVVNDNTITATVPSSGTDGPIQVTNADGTATSSNDFNVTQSNAPTITAFNPTSGPIGTLVTINGTHFNSPAVNDVEFDNHNAASFTVVSDTRITATVPSSGTDGPIQVTNANGTATSSNDFNVTQSPRPTITSFTPTSGPVGTSVMITGANLTGASAVRFNQVRATIFTVNSGTQIRATVPTGATTGHVSVTTPGGTATSTANFTVRNTHARSVTLNLNGHLTSTGSVIAADGFDPCENGVTVKIQKRRLGGGWRTVRTTSTDGSGDYQVGIPDRPGVYRALAPREGTDGDVCSKDKSPRRRHRH
jgi:hypothetical protein